jgi:riboflavin kinase/FMN adenylyltransferase
MEIIRNEEDYRTFKNPVVTLGNFDGIHLGHQKIIKEVKEVASRIDGESIIYTFEPHPLEVLSPRRSFLLINSPEEKLQIFEELGIDVLIYAKFTLAFSRKSPRSFVEDILYRQIGTRSVLVGHNYTFGRGGEGTIEYLIQLGGEFNFGVKVIDPVKVEDTIVSSTRIRGLIKSGEVKLVKRFLGRDFSLQGKIIAGKHRGKKLGFPTANLEIEKKIYPKIGTYAVKVFYRNSPYPGVVNIGYNPTFSDKELSIEVHILNFREDIYNQKLKILFVDRLRDEKKFRNSQELALQIEKDAARAREILLKDWN